MMQTYPATTLDADALAAAVAGLPRFGRIRYFSTVDSTNAQALAMLDDDSALGASLFTGFQQQGRGRAGRRWTSPPGAGLLVTTILPGDLPNRVLPAIGFWTALTVASALETIADLRAEFKWPNDVLLSRKKCCGILIEGKSLGAFSRVVVGVGLNVNRPHGLGAAIAAQAAWLSDDAGRLLDLTKLAVALLAEYERRFDALVSDPQKVIREWSDRALLVGRRLTVKAISGNVLREGVGRGVADDGALLLETQQGTVRISLGDVAVDL